MAERQGEPMTRAQKERLEAELAELEGPARKAVVDAIATARSFGDLSENFEYHAAKKEQGLLERRIAILRSRIDNAVLVGDDISDGVVAVGSHVLVEDEDGRRMDVEISSVGGGVSPASPLGHALLGARTGDEVLVEAPNGTWRARVVSVGR